MLSVRGAPRTDDRPVMPCGSLAGARFDCPERRSAMLASRREEHCGEARCSLTFGELRCVSATLLVRWRPGTRRRFLRRASVCRCDTSRMPAAFRFTFFVRRRSALLTVLVFGAALTGAAVAAASTQVTTLFTGHSGLRVRPAFVVVGGMRDREGVIFGGTRRAGFGHIYWRLWAGADARGTGMEWIDNCKPSCSKGTYVKSGKVTLHASRPTGQHFTRLSVEGPNIRRSYYLIRDRNRWFWELPPQPYASQVSGRGPS
jgi:hypothetical protein